MIEILIGVGVFLVISSMYGIQDIPDPEPLYPEKDKKELKSMYETTPEGINKIKRDMLKKSLSGLEHKLKDEDLDKILNNNSQDGEM